MYIPPHFREERIEVLHELISNQPFAALVTLGTGGLTASHLPCILDRSAGPLGTLRGHLARANPQWREFTKDVDALAIFSGPQHYISPSWYPSKTEHGKVVPTWNYIAVHVYGKLEIIEDREGILSHVRELTDLHERSFAWPWKVDDAPADFIHTLAGSIVGIEMEICRLEGKWKISQNRPLADQAGVVRGLQEAGDPDGIAIAKWIESLSE